MLFSDSFYVYMIYDFIKNTDCKLAVWNAAGNKIRNSEFHRGKEEIFNDFWKKGFVFFINQEGYSVGAQQNAWHKGCINCEAHESNGGLVALQRRGERNRVKGGEKERKEIDEGHVL